MNSRSKQSIRPTGPTTSNGRRIGYYKRESGRLVWIRRIGHKNVLWSHDALTINRPVLNQLVDAGVSLIRYEAPDAIYEISFAEFLSGADIKPRFARGEDVFLVARPKWQTTPKERISV